MNLDDWLQYIESLHPREMELGLDRVTAVARRLDLQPGAARVISVAGTNGKGSCVALLEGLLKAQGCRVGTYTSPHLLRFNERIRVAGQEADDRQLCEVFERIETLRGDTRLTYFEFVTLAALCLFQESQLDVIVLEVGLGGRLDAVNIVDSDVAIITSIDLDHMAWLGETREAIGREKAGILRPGRPLVCADRNPPESILEIADSVSAPSYLIGRDFDLQQDGDENFCNWSGTAAGRQVSLRRLSNPLLNPDAAAAALQALSLLELLPVASVASEVIGKTGLTGRFDLRFDDRRLRRVLLDVAHNPAAAMLLAQRLEGLKNHLPGSGRIILILVQMADKDAAGFVRALASVVDIWYIAQVEQGRCMAASTLAETVTNAVDAAKPVVFENVQDAYQAACEFSSPDDTIVASGSFYVVAEVLPLLDV